MSVSHDTPTSSKPSLNNSEFDFEAFSKPQQTSLPDVFGEGLVLSNSETGSPTDSDRGNKSSPRLVQHCGPDCMITQRIVDRLLARMLELENERSELLAANRSWAVQFQCMKDRYEHQIKKLEEILKSTRRTSESSRRVIEAPRRFIESSRRVSEPSRNLSESIRKSPINPDLKEDTSDEVKLLTRQADVYKEDFLEERKARVRAHAQIEALRRELKRERKSRISHSCLAPQVEDDINSVFS